MFRVAKMLVIAGSAAACAAGPAPTHQPDGSGAYVLRPAPRIKAPRPDPLPADLRARLKRLNEEIRQARDKLGELE